MMGQFWINFGCNPTQVCECHVSLASHCCGHQIGRCIETGLHSHGDITLQSSHSGREEERRFGVETTLSVESDVRSLVLQCGVTCRHQGIEVRDSDMVGILYVGKQGAITAALTEIKQWKLASSSLSASM